MQEWSRGLWQAVGLLPPPANDENLFRHLGPVPNGGLYRVLAGPSRTVAKVVGGGYAEGGSGMGYLSLRMVGGSIYGILDDSIQPVGVLLAGLAEGLRDALARPGVAVTIVPFPDAPRRLRADSDAALLRLACGLADAHPSLVAAGGIGRVALRFLLAQTPRGQRLLRLYSSCNDTGVAADPAVVGSGTYGTVVAAPEGVAIKVETLPSIGAAQRMTVCLLRLESLDLGPRLDPVCPVAVAERGAAGLVALTVMRRYDGDASLYRRAVAASAATHAQKNGLVVRMHARVVGLVVACIRDAHVVPWDLKPANILVAWDGRLEITELRIGDVDSRYVLPLRHSKVGDDGLYAAVALCLLCYAVYTSPSAWRHVFPEALLCGISADRTVRGIDRIYEVHGHRPFRPLSSAVHASPRPESPAVHASPRPESPAVHAFTRPESPAVHAFPRPESPATAVRCWLEGPFQSQRRMRTRKHF